MTEEEIVDFIKNITFDEAKKLKIDSDHITMVNLPDEYQAHLYLTIINSGKETDRYLGWREDEFNGTYWGSPRKRKEEFWDDMQNFENLTLCLSVGDATAMNILESKVLTKVNARTNKKFFNGSNSGGAKTKGLKSINALKNIVKNLINEVYPVLKQDKNLLYDIPVYQVREVPEIPGKVKKISTMITDTKGTWLEDNHKYVLVLEDFDGKGKHKRIGSYHTLKACKTNKWIGSLRVVYIPKKDWINLDTTEIVDLGHFDNKNDTKLNDGVLLKEALNNAYKYCITNGVDHKHDIIKDKFKRWGFTTTEWNASIRKTLRMKIQKGNADAIIPVDHIKKNYSDAELEEIPKNFMKHNKNSHAIVLTTAYFNNKWSSADDLVQIFKDKDALKKQALKIYWHNQSDTAFNKWSVVQTEEDENGNDIPLPTRKTVVEHSILEWMSKLDEKFSFKKIMFEDLPYSEINKIKAGRIK